MMNSHLVRMLIGVGVLASAACSVDVGGEQAVLNEEKRFPVQGKVDLTLSTSDGSIEVRSWDRNEVSVRIERRAATAQEAEALEVQTTQEGNRIVVDAPRRSRARTSTRDSFHIGVWRSPTVSFIVSLPRQVTLAAKTGDGSITAGDLAGAINLQTGDGSIRVDRVEGEVTAHTGDGSIDIVDARGRADLESGDGSIRITGRLDGLRTHSGDGSVHAEASDGSAMKTDWSLTTGDGSITLLLPASFDADVDAQSGDGAVRAEGISSVSTSGDGDRNASRGRLGKGGHTLRVRSGDGGIDIRTR